MWPGRGFGVKNLKPSDCGSVSGALPQTAMGDDREGCRFEVGKVVVVVMVSARKHVEGGVCVQNLKLSDPGSVSGVRSQTATRDDGVGCWVEVGKVVVTAMVPT